MTQALELFQTCTILNPHKVDNLKEVGRCLFVSCYLSLSFLSPFSFSRFLLGLHKNAIQVFKEAIQIQERKEEVERSVGNQSWIEGDWELNHLLVLSLFLLFSFYSSFLFFRVCVIPFFILVN